MSVKRDDDIIRRRELNYEIGCAVWAMMFIICVVVIGFAGVFNAALDRIERLEDTCGIDNTVQIVEEAPDDV